MGRSVDTVLRASRRRIAGTSFVGMLIAGMLAGCVSTPSAQSLQENGMFTVQDLDKFDFLIGRWVGTGPDGKPFYEAYRRVSATQLVSERYADGSFSNIVDGSTVTFENGQIMSTWGDFTWRTDMIEDGFVNFVPTNAPSAFSWRRIDAETVEVMQRWTDENGSQQSYALQLKRAE